MMSFRLGIWNTSKKELCHFANFYNTIKLAKDLGGNTPFKALIGLFCSNCCVYTIWCFLTNIVCINKVAYY